MSEEYGMHQERPYLVDVSCERYERGSWRDFTDCVTREVPVTLHWPGRIPKTLWAAPKARKVLALGHAQVEFCRPDETPVLTETRQDEFWMIPQKMPPAKTPSIASAVMDPSEVMKRMHEFIESEGSWNETGCFHRAGIYDPDTRAFLIMVEDIGRHNCIDRIAGECLERSWNPACHVLFLSARLTASLTAKAIKSSFSMLVSRSAVTTAAIDMAEEHQTTLIGFSRANRFTVFSDPLGRILR